jgi:hypothetical protein
MRFLKKVVLAIEEEEEADGDIGSGASGPDKTGRDGYRRITEVDFDGNNQPVKELEPYREYPWSPKSKDSYPLDTPELPLITDQSFPFNGPLLKRIPFKRSEERVNKNPDTKQTFVKRAMEVTQARRELEKLIQAAEEEDDEDAGIPKEGPQAPPKVPGQDDAKKEMFFPEFLTKVKQAFPTIKETFTKPPTYVWNPKEGADAKIDIPKIKNLLRMKFPDIVWASNYDGNETSSLEFPDNTYANLAIGQDANHLTITYHVGGE